MSVKVVPIFAKMYASFRENAKKIKIVLQNSQHFAKFSKWYEKSGD